MSLVYNRKYELIVGQPDKVVEVDTTTLVEGSTETGVETIEDWRTSNKSGISITDLQVTATIKSNSNNSSTANSTPATIRIFNMSSATREVIEQVNNYVILKAGYEEDPELKMVFAGQVETFETVREGQNLVTTLQCKDGYTPSNSVRISKTYGKVNTYADILLDLASIYAKNGVPEGDITVDWLDAFDFNSTLSQGEWLPENYVQLPVIKVAPANYRLINGYSAMGYLHQVLENVCDQIGYVSYITNGRLFIHPKGFTKMVEEFEFTSDQMISIRKSGTKATSSSIGKGNEGITLTTFLDGRLDVDKRVKILDGAYKGNYKIITKSHTLDYEGSAWTTTVECKQD